MPNVSTYPNLLYQISVRSTRAHQCRKAPGYDLISGKVLKELQKKAITLLSMLYNGFLRVYYYTLLWKFAQILMVPKAGKSFDDVTSYRPTSLLPIPYKVFDNLLQKRLRKDLDLSGFLPDYEFGFRFRPGIR